MDTPLPGMATEVCTVDTPVRVAFTEVSSVYTTECCTNEEKKKGIRGFFKRTWKAVKRPFRRSSHETRVVAIVPPLLPDTAAPCASGLQRTPDRKQVVPQLASVSGPCLQPTTALPPDEGRSDDELEVVSITSSDCLSVCSHMEQDSELPADAEATESVSLQDHVEIKPQEQHAKEKKRKGIRGFFKRTWKTVKRLFRRRSHETSVEAIVLPDTAVPTEAAEIINVQDNAKSKRRGRFVNDDEERKNKGICGFLRRQCKAVKRPFRRLRRKTRVEDIVLPDTPVQTPDKEQISLSEVSSVIGLSATESVRQRGGCCASTAAGHGRPVCFRPPENT